MFPELFSFDLEAHWSNRNSTTLLHWPGSRQTTRDVALKRPWFW
ncbi:hypothetical protein SynMVIR181_02326 [Synechococcus sp. MVIR-18-1]|nr:hypothetical protein SynMVIR181_02326 [Synechococcus sp. MVIR-18-1]